MTTNKIFLVKWNQILDYIYKNDGIKTSSEIHMDLNITYSHVVKVIQEMELRKWINTVKEGRKKFIVLTSDGEVIARVNTMIVDIVNRQV